MSDPFTNLRETGPRSVSRRERRDAALADGDEAQAGSTLQGAQEVTTALTPIDRAARATLGIEHPLRARDPAEEHRLFLPWHREHVFNKTARDS